MELFERVMCVEDDPDIRMILDFSLGRMGGYTLSLCESGPQALERVAEFRPQLVLLDVMMPEMSGPETLIQLRALPVMQGVPIVFLTAKGYAEDEQFARKAGADAYLLKPFNAAQLEAAIAPLLKSQ